jgi:hypothetical protein
MPSQVLAIVVLISVGIASQHAQAKLQPVVAAKAF